MPHDIGLHVNLKVFKVLLVLMEQIGIGALPFFGIIDSVLMLANLIIKLLGDGNGIGLTSGSPLNLLQLLDKLD